jgi:hypothetical protein
MQEETTSRVMAADKPYGEFYYICSVSPECFGFILVLHAHRDSYNTEWQPDE